MSENRTIPDGLYIFTGTTKPDNEGKQYGFEFLAENFERAKFIAEKIGLSTKLRDLGQLEQMGDMTPDGPLTTWDRDTTPGRARRGDGDEGELLMMKQDRDRWKELAEFLKYALRICGQIEIPQGHIANPPSDTTMMRFIRTYVRALGLGESPADPTPHPAHVERRERGGR